MNYDFSGVSFAKNFETKEIYALGLIGKVQLKGCGLPNLKRISDWLT